jgi:hypothetical protein
MLEAILICCSVVSLAFVGLILAERVSNHLARRQIRERPFTSEPIGRTDGNS